MTLADLFPDFSRELQVLTAAAGRPDLATKLPPLPVVARCTCGDDNCAHFYAEKPPSGSYEPGHENLMLPATELPAEKMSPRTWSRPIDYFGHGLGCLR